MNILKEVEKIYQEVDEKETPTWAKQILKELQEIKRELLKLNKKDEKQRYQSYVKSLRRDLRQDNKRGIKPYLIYHDKKIGLNKDGFLYELDSEVILSSNKVFEIFNYFFKNQEKLSIRY